ncbi:ATP-binding protein [Streptococcus parauberis]|uniref:ATP-binding protein n=1 Tax=Streptococcus parauberis TaxID=1348 RepID=UPI000C14B7BD|nr:ATP-binding protein [Streptococcus parauberis]PIA86449.1 hypothetical protein ADO07_00120 [Streptococcus parauberis]
MNSKIAPQEIYNFTLLKIDNLLNSMSEGNINEEIDQYRFEAIQKLKEIKVEVNSNILSLKNNSVWDTFTIALYGETNAGKSTLIETIRILLNEQKKNEQHKNYKLLQSDFYELKNKINELKNNIELLHKKITILHEQHTSNLLNIEKENTDKINSILNQIEQNNNAIEISNFKKIEYLHSWFDLSKEIELINNSIQNNLLSSSINVIISFFHTFEEQHDRQLKITKIKELNKEISNNENDISKLIENNKLLTNEIDSLTLNIKNNEEKEIVCYKNLENENFDEITRNKHTIELLELKNNKLILELTSLSDGEIIGDGRSDFTQKVGTYSFTIDNQNFAILDLPGIEGKEKDVQFEIDKAIETAHSVFYVSKKPNPPQKGDDGVKGTIEKISKHLAQHSEIYFIYNKPVRNPRQLKEPLIDNNEHQSLDTVDIELLNVLGQSYVGHKNISAYPAFLSVGKFFNTKYLKDQDKFLDRFKDPNKLLDLSNMSEFTNWMTHQLISDVKNKIIKSNQQKVYSILETTISEIQYFDDSFNKLTIDLRTNFLLTSKKIDIIGNTFYRNIISSGQKSTNTLTNNIRKKIYLEIENGISDKELEQYLQKYLKEENKKFKDNIQFSIKKNNFDFSEDIKEVTNTFQVYTKDLFDKHLHLNKLEININTNFKIKNNIDVKETIADILFSLIGLIFTLSNPIMAAISGFTLFIVVLKKFLSFTDSEHHMAQQRKIVNNKIDEITEKIQKALKSQQDEIKIEIDKGISDIKNQLNQYVIQSQTISDTFKAAKTDFSNLSQEIINDRSKS